MSSPHTLSSKQQDMMRELVDALEPIEGVLGVALGGSYARGFAREDSDIDLGVYYSEQAPLDIEAIRDVATRFPGSSAPIVSQLFEWGPWVNGGAWLTIEEQRVDFLYRSVEQIDRTIRDAEAGKYELHFGQQPPFGFFSPTYLGELKIAIPLLDPLRTIANLQARVATYPDALRRQVVQDYLWSVEFGLTAFAAKFAGRGDIYLTVATISRHVHALVLVLFALNREYLVNDKTALVEVDAFSLCPKDFRACVEAVLSNLGSGTLDLERAVSTMRTLFDETVLLAGDLYESKYNV